MGHQTQRHRGPGAEHTRGLRWAGRWGGTCRLFHKQLLDILLPHPFVAGIAGLQDVSQRVGNVGHFEGQENGCRCHRLVLSIRVGQPPAAICKPTGPQIFATSECSHHWAGACASGTGTYKAVVAEHRLGRVKAMAVKRRNHGHLRVTVARVRCSSTACRDAAQLALIGKGRAATTCL